MKIPKEIVSVLKKKRYSSLGNTHQSGMATAIGFCPLALSSALELWGKEVHVYMKDRVPEISYARLQEI